jgi:hypothetical protein
MKYALVEEIMTDVFTAEVNGLLSEGWQLYGPPIINELSDGRTFYYQALTKED